MVGSGGHMHVLDTPSPQCLSSSVSQWREEVKWSSLTLTLVLGKGVCVCVFSTENFFPFEILRKLKSRRRWLVLTYY